LNKEIIKKYSNNNYVVLVVLSMSLALLSTTAIQAIPANAANTNVTQQAGAAANQTGEKAQAGAANVTQEAKSGTNQAGQTA
jgi:cytoskeletal protein RodZ